MIISRSATTTLSVDSAQKTGLTVIGFARGAKMNIYTHAQRVKGIASVTTASYDPKGKKH